MKALLSAFVFCLTAGSLFAQCDCPPINDRPVVTVSGDPNGTGTTTWTCQNTYVLSGYVFVTPGQVLTVEAGTVIKGAPGFGTDASALIVARGAQIFAEGTQDCPIVMTYEADPLDGSIPYDTRGQWGGLIVLGNATLNTNGPAQVEGIPSDNDLAIYGGPDDLDNSGVIQYVSVRHGGAEIGAANEINGITLAGVGAGTTVDYVEVVSNLDDGIEIFGGAVSVKHALVAFAGDDSFDWDQGFHGQENANWMVILDQPGDIGDRGGELDGDDSDGGNVTPDEQPYAIPTISGWTVIGRDMQYNNGTQGLLFRNGSGGNVSNAVLCNVEEGIEIEHKETPEDAFDRWEAGDLTLNNIVVIGGDALDYDGTVLGDGDDILDAYAEANGVVVNLDFEMDHTFDFDDQGLLANDTLNLECGLGSGHVWALGWTFCDQRNVFGGEGGPVINAVEESEVNVTVWPNPSSGSLHIAGLAVGTDIEVLTLAGAQVWKGQVTPGMSVATHRWEAGAYLLIWEQEGRIGRQRFLVH